MASTTWMCVFVWLCCTVILGCYGHHWYRDHMPNGHNVTDPCDKNVAWKRVGHMTDTRADKIKNQFGMDFQNAAAEFGAVKAWSKICELDSDGDGKTNGVELGDPKCQWPEKSAKKKRLSHPGLDDVAYRRVHCPNGSKGKIDTPLEKKETSRTQ